MRFKSTLAVVLSISAAASAQSTACRTQPGAPLGVVSYSCASCGIQKSADAPPTPFFGSEPVVTEGLANGPYKSGDIITAVNGSPITTREGAQAFATPLPGKNTVGFRRSDDGALWAYVATVTVTSDCQMARGFDMKMQRIVTKSSGLQTLKSVDIPNRPHEDPTPDPTARVGFAVTCTPGCAKVTDKDGRSFWKHEGYPAVVAVRAGSPAADGGLMVGDLIAELNGVSVTEEAGSRLLQSYGNTTLTAASCIKCEVPYMKLVIIRNGAKQTLTIQLRERQ